MALITTCSKCGRNKLIDTKNIHPLSRICYDCARKKSDIKKPTNTDNKPDLNKRRF